MHNHGSSRLTAIGSYALVSLFVVAELLSPAAVGAEMLSSRKVDGAVPIAGAATQNQSATTEADTSIGEDDSSFSSSGASSETGQTPDDANPGKIEGVGDSNSGDLLPAEPGESLDSAEILPSQNGENQLEDSDEEGDVLSEDSEAQGGADNQIDASDEGDAGEINLTYEAHVAELGWQGAVGNGEVAGTTGRGLAIEALRFNLEGAPAESLQIGVHISDIGWKDAVASDELAGTTGESKSLEAVTIALSDGLAARFDIWYRVHAANFGWLGWTANGECAGSEGYGYGIEAVEILLVDKGSFVPPEDSTPAFRDRADEPPSLTYRAHLSNVGWQGAVSDGSTAGTTGRSLPVEALEVSLSWWGHDAGVDVRTHVQDLGWQNWVIGTGGTTGRSLSVEAVQLRLTGEIVETHDIWYRVHVAQLGWMDWAANGEAAGTTGAGHAIEAIEIRLVPKGGEEPGPTENHYAGPLESLGGSYRDITGAAMAASDSNNLLCGSEDGQPLQSFGLTIVNPLNTGSVRYRVRYQFSDWEGEWEADGNQTSDSQDGRQIEGVKIELDGQIAQVYDVWYQAYTTERGWSGWAANGEAAGSEGLGAGIRSLAVKLLPKGAEPPGSTEGAYYASEDHPALLYQAHSADIGWQGLVHSGEAAGTTGKSKALEAIRIGLTGTSSGAITVEAHAADLGWLSAVGNGDVAGTTGENRPIQAVKISLTGEIATQYDVVYRVHAAQYGWLGWAMNGGIAGTTGLSRSLEAIEIQLVEKGSFETDDSVPAYIPAGTVSYQTLPTSLEWQNVVSNGASSGTMGQSRALNGVRISYDDSSIPGGVAYSVHVADIGWMSDVYDGADAGATGLDKRIEAIRIRLTGDAATYYDIWYRTYIEEYGWLDWAKNGSPAGSGSIGYRMEAIEVVMTAKGSPAPGSTAKPYTEQPIRLNSVLLGVPALGQNPELPTGCESVALTNVLNYYGFGLGKTVIADQYMPKSSWDFVTSFWGDPHSSYNGNCISAPGIVNTANSFLVSRGSGLRAYDITGVSLEGMYSHLQNGNPVIVWSTMYQQNIGPQYAWQSYGGRQYFTVTNSHTVVLRGFDRSANVVYLADSLSGYVTMDANRFFLLYSLRGSQAVVVR